MTKSLAEMEYRAAEPDVADGASEVALPRGVGLRWVAREAVAGLGGELRLVRRDLGLALGRLVASARGRVRVMVAGELGPWWQGASPSPSRRLAQVLRRHLAPLPTGVADGSPVPEHGATGRHRLRWRQGLAVGVCAFAVWLLFDAPTLMHSAEASPLGARRSAALVILRPLSRVSEDIGLSHLVGTADRVLGRDGRGVVQVVGPAARAAAPGRQGSGLHRSSLPASDTLAPLAAPTAAAPLRVLSVGDSLGVDFGGPFVDALAATGVVNAALDAHIDTGLSRPDYFDWPGELHDDLVRYQSQAVVVFLGANDPQNFVDGGQALAYGTPAWSAAYARRVGQFMEEATSTGARVLWVGMPPMADPALDAKMEALDNIYQSEAGAHPGVTYFSSWSVFSDQHGDFAQFLPDASGNEVAVREPDGTHVSPDGAARLSQSVIDAMDRAWGLYLRP
ncbi:MAG TPA: DUF459 domain-containing protein [Acidimicrobiales bacterium]|nr:DUF459 domain-containing protein [Acidimicrobiales bacterium]